MQFRRARRSAAAAVAGICLGGLLAAVAYALPSRGQERPTGEVTAYVADLRKAAALAEQAAAATAGLEAGSKACSQVSPAAGKLAAAAEAAKAVFQRYQRAKTRYGTQEEIELIATVAISLREARGQLEKAAGKAAPPSAAEQRAAEREVGLFQTFVALEIEDRLEVEGLADVLTSLSFGEMKTKIVAELRTRLRERAEAELRRITGLRIRLNVPLKEQIHDFLQAELSRLLSKLAVSAGPAGILVSILGQRIFGLLGAKLAAALRNKGDVEKRARASIGGLKQLREQLNVPKDTPVDRVRAAVRAAKRELGRTGFLEADLERAIASASPAKRQERQQLLDELRAAKKNLQRTIGFATHRFLLDSALVGEDFGVAVAYSAKVRADAERLAKKLGCQLPAGGSAGTPPDKGVAPTAAVCPPPFTMESFNYAGTKLGEFAVTGPTLTRVYPEDPYVHKCLYFNPTDKGENFVVFIDAVPPNLPGRIASGDCSRNRPDSPPFYHSRKRYLGVSGGSRRVGSRAAGGDQKILLQALKLAEAAGVGQACPKR